MTAVLEQRLLPAVREYWIVLVVTVVMLGLLAAKQQWHHPATPSPQPVWVDPFTHVEVAS